MLLAAVAVALVLGPPTVAAQDEPAPAPGWPTAPSEAEAAALLGDGPMWLPLRLDLDGQEITVGCTYRSRGSANGYECGGHHGRWALDFIAATGTPVYPARSGFATDVTGQRGGGGFGNVVQVDHGGGSTTIYAHLERSLVPAEGRWVDEDDQIGTVGSTGSSSTPHLHFERFQQDPDQPTGTGPRTSVDPGPLFACRGDWLISYPEVAGHGSWAGQPWGSFTVGSDGPRCALPDPALAQSDAADAGDPRTDVADAAANDPDTAGGWGSFVGSLFEDLVLSRWWLLLRG